MDPCDNTGVFPDMDWSEVIILALVKEMEAATLDNGVELHLAVKVWLLTCTELCMVVYVY